MLAEQSCFLVTALRAVGTAHSWVCPLKTSQLFSTAGYRLLQTQQTVLQSLQTCWDAYHIWFSFMLVAILNARGQTTHICPPCSLECTTHVQPESLSVLLSNSLLFLNCVYESVRVPETTVPQFKISQFLYSLMWDITHKLNAQCQVIICTMLRKC